MESWADEQLAELKPRFPKWDIWYVYCQPKHYVWCARPIGTPKATINADSPESLVVAIAEQEAGPRRDV